MLTLEAWVQTLPMLSDSAKQTILADCLEDGRNREDLDEVASGGSSEARPSLTKMVELLDDEMRIFEQDLAELKETMRSCEARIKPQVVQKDPREGANFYDDGTRLDRTSSPDDGASTATGNLPPRPPKRPHLVTPDLEEATSGAAKMQKTTAWITTPPVPRPRPPKKRTDTRKGSVSDTAWAEGRATSSRDLPIQRPVRVFFRNRKWQYRSASGDDTFYDTVDRVYDAAIRDQQQHPPVPQNNPSGLSDEMWHRERTMSSLDFPEERPKGLRYVPSRKRWLIKVQHGDTVSQAYYISLDAAYNALATSYHEAADDDNDNSSSSSKNHEKESTTPSATNDLPSPTTATTDLPSPPRNYTSGLSDEMWQQERMMSSLDLPEKRPQGLHYVKLSKKWRLRVAQNRDTPLYPSLDAAYNALRGSTSSF